MKVTTDMNRLDMIWFNLSLTPRVKSTWVFFGVLAIGYFIYFGMRRPPHTPTEWALVGAISIFAGLTAVAVLTIVGLVLMLLTASAKSGILGKHDYELTSEGIRESTVVNDQVSRWAGIHSVKRVGSYLMVRVAPHIAHVIPRRAFSSNQEFEAFVSQAKAYFDAARASSPYD